MGEESLAALFDGLCGSDVLIEATLADADPRRLSADEWLAIAPAVPVRRAEYAAGRLCARRLLARLGAPATSLLARTNGRPDWPEGVVGSIAHAGGWCAVAVARRDRVGGVGIDIELARGLEEAAWEVMCTPRELAWLHRAPRAEAALSATALFSAKESAFKCRTGGAAFEPGTIEIDWDGRGPAFVARSVDFVAGALAGRIRVGREWIVSAVVAPPDALGVPAGDDPGAAGLSAGARV